MRITAADKLQRIISIVSWVNAQDGPLIDDVCERFSIGRDELIAQLEVASMVGDEGGDYGDMPIELYFDDERVHVYLTAFERPLRLTPEQGLALLTAGYGLAQVGTPDPEGPLDRALAKVAAVVGIEPGDGFAVDLGEADAAVLDQLRTAVAEHRPLALDYWSAGRDSRTEREVEPWRVFNEGGAWYLQAHCRLADGERIFRVDRIRGLGPVDGTFDPPSDLPKAVAYRAGADDPRVVIDLRPAAHWVAAQYPVDHVEERRGQVLRVTMPAGAPAFMARLLLRLGPDATLVGTDDSSEARAATVAAANRILDRYRTG